MSPRILIINEADNVGVALEDVPAGAVMELSSGGSLSASTDVPFSHKVALKDLSRGDPLIKYGEVIGRAACDIRAGEWVHTHNLETEDTAG